MNIYTISPNFLVIQQPSLSVFRNRYEMIYVRFALDFLLALFCKVDYNSPFARNNTLNLHRI